MCENSINSIATVSGATGCVMCVLSSGIRQSETDEEVWDDAEVELMQTDSGHKPYSKGGSTVL